VKLPAGSIDELLAPYGPKVIALATATRRRIISLVPHAVGRLRPGWGLIGYSAPKYFAFVVPVKGGVRLGFEWGVRLDDPAKLLEGDGSQVRFVTITRPSQLRRRELAQLISRAASQRSTSLRAFHHAGSSRPRRSREKQALETGLRAAFKAEAPDSSERERVDEKRTDVVSRIRRRAR
jgi:hypothetical protein